MVGQQAWGHLYLQNSGSLEEPQVMQQEAQSCSQKPTCAHARNTLPAPGPSTQRGGGGVSERCLPPEGADCGSGSFCFLIKYAHTKCPRCGPGLHARSSARPSIISFNNKCPLSSVFRGLTTVNLFLAHLV